jgi:hypothetical protein
MLGLSDEQVTPEAAPAAVGILVGVVALMLTMRHVVAILLTKAEEEAQPATDAAAKHD